MMRNLNIIVPVAVMLTLSAAGFGQTPPAGATANPQITYSTAPLPVVYNLFIRELVAIENHGDQLAASGKTPTETRALFRGVTGLNEADYQFLLASGRACVATLDQTEAELKTLAPAVNGATPPAMTPATKARVVQLLTVKANAAMDVMTAIRVRLGSQGFDALQQRIRQYVVPRMTTHPAAPSAVKEVGK